MSKNNSNPQILSIDFEEFRNTYQDGITPQSHPLEKDDKLCFGMNPKARVLVAYVPQENAKPFEELKASEYFTRPKFPNTINLKDVEYFVPYFKGKGIRDIYKVHHINTCTKKEFDPESDDERMRLLFQFKFVRHLFDAYKPHDLKIWYCFTDTSVKELIEEKTIVRFIDLFAGIGGIRLGLEQAAHELGYDTECVMTSEIKTAAIKVLKQNHPQESICGDITQIDSEDIPNFDILCAGFPCQAFSYAGKRMGFEDARGTLFFEVARILRDKRPKGFILENVEGLVTHDGGKTFEVILSILNSLHYRVSYRVLNSKDFGVPQERKRIYIVGAKGKTVGLESFEIIHNYVEKILEKGQPLSTSSFVNNLLRFYSAASLQGKKIKDKRGGDANIHSWDLEMKGHITKGQKDLLNQILHERRKHKWAEIYGIDWMDGMPLTIDMIRQFYDVPNLKDMLDDLVEKGYLVYEPPKKVVVTPSATGIVRSRQRDSSLPKGYNIVAGKLSFEVSEILDPKGYSPTLVAMDMHRIHVVDGEGIRQLTLTEGKRLFGYPDNYIMDVSVKEGYDLLGNTVVVPVIKAVANRLLKTIQ
jgi:DNA (cytosine-5)-methyltransferase 1